GEVLVMDWGVAKILREETHESADSESGESLEKPGSEFDTDHGTVLGTPSYMAPEQARGELTLLSPRSDVYSLGAVLFFLLTGQDPPENQAIGTALKTSHPKIPRALEAVCVKAMSTDPAQRYESAEQMGTEISRFLDGLSVSAYQETFLEKSGRWILKNQFILILIFTYLFFRVLLLVISGR
ncbi:MAG TPA: hypothetical protein VFG11_09810, partial [Acidobacteriota bacterium]|nr:hypothetical protein [Acidobacteriota bacterium]